MIKPQEYQIELIESNGERLVFDPVALQETLVRAFRGAGLRDDSYLAEDIALAVECAFAHSSRPEPVFTRSELNSAVVRILEDTGLAEVARVFRRGAPELLTVSLRTDRPTIRGVLDKYLAGSPGHLEELAAKVAAAAGRLNIGSAAPGLLLELARHYENEAPELPPEPSHAPDAVPAVIDQASARTVFDETLRRLCDDGIIAFRCDDRVFPRIALSCSLMKFAAGAAIVPPVTEMQLEPALFALGEQLERCRIGLLRLYRERTGRPAAELPLFVTVPDMGEFVAVYLGADGHRPGRLARDLGQMLCVALKSPVEKFRASPLPPEKA